MKKINDRDNYKKLNYKKLEYIGKTIDWTEINQISDPNEATNQLIKKIQNSIKEAEITNTIEETRHLEKIG